MTRKLIQALVFISAFNLQAKQSSDEIILQIKNKLPSLRHDSRQLKSRSEMNLLKEYLDAKYKIDPELRSLFVMIKESDKWVFDNFIAGTFPRESLQIRISEVLSEKHKKGDEILNLFLKLKEDSNLSFGFDGFEQNGCAAPTAFLLIMDNKRGRVDGIDLNPCQE